MLAIGTNCQNQSGAPSGSAGNDNGGSGDSPDTPIIIDDYSDYRIVAAPLEGGGPGEWSFTIDPGGQTLPADLRFDWYFGGGQSQEGPEQTFTFEESGTHVVVVTAYEDDNAVAFVLTVDVEVSLSDEADFAAVAGANQSVTEGDTICLEGGAEPAMPSLAYVWQQIEGPTVSLAPGDVPTGVCFEAPEVDDTVSLIFELEVSDGTHVSTDSVVVTVENAAAPATVLVAEAGDDQEVASGTLVTLDGSASHGDGDDVLTFLWGQDTGPAVALTNADAAIATFTAPAVSGEAQDLLFTLTVTQGDATASDDVLIRVTPVDSGGGGGTSGCVDNADCDDGQYCTVNEACVSGTCTAGDPRDCSALDDICLAGVCNETLDTCEAAPVANGTGCDDGSVCTVGDVCTDGACAGTSLPDRMACDDGDPGTDQSICVGGQCAASVAYTLNTTLNYNCPAGGIFLSISTFEFADDGQTLWVFDAPAVMTGPGGIAPDGAFSVTGSTTSDGCTQTYILQGQFSGTMWTGSFEAQFSGCGGCGWPTWNTIQAVPQ
jgi:hypothetical protein